MDLTKLTPVNIRGFAEELAKLEIPEVEIPKFHIPSWPVAAKNVQIKLGKREFRLPIRKQGTGLLMLQRMKRKISFHIKKDGTIYAILESFDYYYSPSSDDSDNLNRIQILLLFQQFKEELFTKITEQLKADLVQHSETAEMVRQAFEPFIPFVVMDQLTS